MIDIFSKNDILNIINEININEQRYDAASESGIKIKQPRVKSKVKTKPKTKTTGAKSKKKLPVDSRRAPKPSVAAPGAAVTFSDNVSLNSPQIDFFESAAVRAIASSDTELTMKSIAFLVDGRQVRAVGWKKSAAYKISAADSTYVSKQGDSRASRLKAWLIKNKKYWEEI